eukprot:13029837-Ditylum_brightwellii.AAC.1
MSKLKQKKLHEVFFIQQKEIPQVDLEQSNKWLTKGSLSGGTEAALCAGMEQMLATNAIKNKIFKLECSLLCHLCQQTNESVRHIVSAFPKLVGTKYTQQHNDVAKYIHWNMLKERGVA